MVSKKQTASNPFFFKRLLPIVGIAFLTVLFSCQTAPQKGFEVKGTKLYDGNGNEFIMRGVNVPLVWFINESLHNFGNIKETTGSNCVRLVWEIKRKIPDVYLVEAVDSCLKYGMIPVLEIHDATGSNDTTHLLNIARWWATKADFFNNPKYAKYLILNIANEWGDWKMGHDTPELWGDAYVNAVAIIRNAGIKCPIMIDGADWGKDLNAIKLHGNRIVESDPLKNIIFSVHTYCVWTDPVNFDNQVQEVVDLGLCLVSGELANFHWACGPLDVVSFMRTLNSRNMGYLAWSWTGNGGPDAVLDLSHDWAGQNLSDWGNVFLNDPNGVKATVKPCSYFAK